MELCPTLFSLRLSKLLCFIFFLLRYLCSRFLTFKNTYLALLQRLLNLMIVVEKNHANWKVRRSIKIPRVSYGRKPKNLSNYVDIIFPFLSYVYLPDERMTNRENANKTCVEFLSKSDWRKKVRPMFASRLETLSKMTISKPVTHALPMNTEEPPISISK